MERGIKKTDYNRKSCKSIITTYQSLQHEQFIHHREEEITRHPKYDDSVE
jgi:hypothetical protein